MIHQRRNSICVFHMFRRVVGTLSVRTIIDETDLILNFLNTKKYNLIKLIKRTYKVHIRPTDVKLSVKIILCTS